MKHKKKIHRKSKAHAVDTMVDLYEGQYIKQAASEGNPFGRRASKRRRKRLRWITARHPLEREVVAAYHANKLGAKNPRGRIQLELADDRRAERYAAIAKARAAREKARRTAAGEDFFEQVEK